MPLSFADGGPSVGARDLWVLARGDKGVAVTDSYGHGVTLHGTLVPNIESFCTLSAPLSSMTEWYKLLTW